jgi:hypothetical protein
MAYDITIREMQESDKEAVMKIFNHYAATSFAACPDGPLPPQFFGSLREDPYLRLCWKAMVVSPDSGSSSPSSLSLYSGKPGC